MQQTVGGNRFKAQGILSLVLLLFISLTASRCEREEDPMYRDFIFVLNFEINPADSLISLGDTLWLTAEFDNKIEDFISKEKFELIDFNFKTLLGFFRLQGKTIGLPLQPGATSSFDLVNKKGSVSNAFETFADFDFDYNSGMYSCEIGIVPKSKGVFCLNFLSPASRDIRLSNTITLPDTPDGRKVIPLYRNIYYVINEGQTNFDLYKKHSVASSEILVTTDNIYYEQKGTFTFRVID